jgi:hypothetical protein
MPASLLELKKRIASVKQTSKITEAMHMVSAAKLNQTGKKRQGLPGIQSAATPNRVPADECQRDRLLEQG